MIQKNVGESGFFATDSEQEHEASKHQLDDAPRDINVMTERFGIYFTAVREQAKPG